MHGISTIRGVQTGATSPLIILDNFPYEGDINNINPNDIESVTLLKDAAAASIWGAKAGNGVIVITTKKGVASRRLTITANLGTNITEKPNLFAREAIKSTDIIDLEILLFENGFFNNQETNRSKPALSPIVELLIQYRDHKLDSVETFSQIDTYRQNDVRRDMLRHVYRESINQQYALGMDGGGDVHKFRVFAGYDKMLNSQHGNENDRVNLKFENSLMVMPNLELNGRILWTRTSNQYVGLGSTGANFSNDGYRYPYIRFVDDNGNHLPIPYEHRMGFLDTAGYGKLLDWHYRPLDELNNPSNHIVGQEIMLDLGAQYKMKDWINLELRYRYNKGGNEHKNYASLANYDARNLINRFTQIQEDGLVVHAMPMGGILRVGHSEYKASQLRGQINIKHNWANRHDLRALAGFDVQERITESKSYNTYGYDDNYLTYVSNIDHNGTYPIFANLDAPSTIPNIRNFGYTNNRFS